MKFVSRLVGSSAKAILALPSVAISRAFGRCNSGRASKNPSRSLCRAIAARPAMPLPRNRRIRSVSAWSSLVCALQIEGAGETLDVERLARGFGPQAVIDGDRDKPRTARKAAPPARGEPHQRDRIGAARDRKHDRGRSLPVREQTFGVACRERGFVVVGHGLGHVLAKNSAKS